MQKWLLSVAMIVITSGAAAAQTPIAVFAPTHAWEKAVTSALGPDWVYVAEGPDMAKPRSIDQVSAIWGGPAGARITVTTSIASHPTRSENAEAWQIITALFENELRVKTDEKKSLAQGAGGDVVGQCDEVRAAQYAAVTGYGAMTSFYRTLVLCSLSPTVAVFIEIETLEIPSIILPDEVGAIIGAIKNAPATPAP
ncbi:MAG: hypothetical protein ACR2OE_14390 [Thermomicrobiales bacterium]